MDSDTWSSDQEVITRPSSPRWTVSKIKKLIAEVIVIVKRHLIREREAMSDPEILQPSSSGAADVPCSSSSSSDEPAELITRGKRHLYCEDFEVATTYFQEACEKLAAKYGQVADECGEAYFYYGRSLLELARQDASLFDPTNATGKAAAEDADDSEDSDGNNVSALPVATANLDPGWGSSSQDDCECCSGNNDTNAGDNIAKEQIPQAVDDDSGDEDQGKEDAGDTNVLQLAWEMLELSRIIYSRKDNKDSKLRSSEIYLELGQIGLESEQYDQAIIDFKSALSLQLQTLEHYNIALAYLYNRQYDEAVESFTDAVAVVKNRLANLAEVIENHGGTGKKPDELTKERREVEELQSIIPDINAKIEDAKEEKRQLIASSAASVKQLMESALGDNFGMQSSSSGNAQATSINHLVRRKRKDEDNNVDVKKAKLDVITQEASTESERESVQESKED
ncbi:Nuclear autoantigenic sperm protein [Trichoplax sp. H2]|nr:Nuclear autoantigenic sperm protein [Trichoplax sp. H2]|eukprot:RDD42194.1 Nuclear autoantigenic sperm protein [Trichoplax sp. H2]